MLKRSIISLLAVCLMSAGTGHAFSVPSAALHADSVRGANARFLGRTPLNPMGQLQGKVPVAVSTRRARPIVSMSSQDKTINVGGLLAGVALAANMFLFPTPIDATPTVPPQMEKEDTGGGFADLPPCLPWSKGDCVTINGPCFALDEGCGASFKPCAASGDCRKGMSCIARCGGDPTCTTGCFAAFGDEKITDFLGCALEGKKCLDFPKDPKLLGWLDDSPNAPKRWRACGGVARG